MEINHNGIHRTAQRTGFEFAVDGGERIVERCHEDSTHGIDDQGPPAVLGLDQRRAAAWRALRKIRRANQPRGAFDEHQRLALVPGMVAERDSVGPYVDEFLIDRLGDAEAAGGVLAVDDDALELPCADEGRQPLGYDIPPAAADHISHEQDAHAFRSRDNR